MKKLITIYLIVFVGIVTAAAAEAAEFGLKSDKQASSPFLLAQDDAAPEESSSSGGKGITGYLESDFAYTYASPGHWSKGMLRAEPEHQGRIGEGLKYKISGRLGYDPIYDNSNFYPKPVREDQRYDFQWRETYIDAEAGDWDMRFGRQNIVWGEMVGLFFADVVSARDLREFILPDFDVLRIPQWAARAEYFKDDFHAEFIWIPYASYDNIGKPGSDFFPVPVNPHFPLVVLGDEQPGHSVNNSNYGMRLSILKDGWDVAGFAYRSFDVSPVLAFDPSINAYRQQHDRINQFGGTLAKDFGSMVLKVESVYTHGRRFFTLNPTSVTGLVPSDTFLYVAGLEFALPGDINFNVQLFDNLFLDHNAYFFNSKNEAGTTLLLKKSFEHNIDAQTLLIRSLNRDDWLLSPQIKWGFQQNWALTSGVNIFDGPRTGYFGQYRDRDRLFTNLRYSF